jgi:hypothetical protein
VSVAATKDAEFGPNATAQLCRIFSRLCVFLATISSLIGTLVPLLSCFFRDRGNLHLRASCDSRQINDVFTSLDTNQQQPKIIAHAAYAKGERNEKLSAKIEQPVNSPTD